MTEQASVGEGRCLGQPRSPSPARSCVPSGWDVTSANYCVLLAPGKGLQRTSRGSQALSTRLLRAATGRAIDGGAR